LMESVLLALAGGVVGLLLATWGTDLLVAYGPADVPRLRDVGVDRYVLFFTLGLATLTGIVFGLAPALHASKPAPGNMLKESGRGVYTGRNRMRSALIVSEVALSLMLLAGAGLCVRTFTNLNASAIGVRPDGVVLFAIEPPRLRYTPERLASLLARVQQKVATIPGVQAASFSNEPRAAYVGPGNQPPERTYADLVPATAVTPGRMARAPPTCTSASATASPTGSGPRAGWA